MINNPRTLAGDEELLKLVEQVKAYFLTPGTIVQVTEEDPSSGLSKIRMAGITLDLWTLTRFLSKHAVKDTYGVIETPETSGLIPTATSAIDAGPWELRLEADRNGKRQTHSEIQSGTIQDPIPVIALRCTSLFSE